MRAGVRGAGDVGGEDCEFGFVGQGLEVVFADEPDEARAEHGVCGGDKGAAEGGEGGE